MAAKQIVFVIAHEGFQPVEYDVPRRILEESGLIVVTASDKIGSAVASDGTTTVDVQLLIDDINVDDCSGIFFIGGPGALEHLDNEKSYALLRKVKEKKKLYGAICISPRILAKAGVLEHKKATGWDGDEQLIPVFDAHNVDYVRQDVVIDGSIVTAVGPQAAHEFGAKILSLIS